VLLRKIKYLTVCVLLFVSTQSLATHIIGGEIFYEKLANNDYRITIKIYRDCYNGVPWFDDPLVLNVFDNSNNFIKSISVPVTSASFLDPTLNSPCLNLPPNICVEEGIYIFTTNLPPIAGGYQLAHQRCCRNNTILNMIAPGSTGFTLYTVIPDEIDIVANNSPSYDNFPPIFVCVNELLEFDHVATDLDGDSLVYRLCTPFVGASTTDPTAINVQNPPYSEILWQNPFNLANPLGGVPLNIDQNGYLTGEPNMLGQFVVGVCVDEYRDGFLISTNKRDFQFNVVYCEPVSSAAIPGTINVCEDTKVTFDIDSIKNAISYLWDFGDPSTTSDISSQQIPTYTYPDTGTYTVTLIVNVGLTCADTAQSLVKIYTGSDVDFTYNDNCVNELFFFQSTSTIPSGSIIETLWYENGDLINNAPVFQYNFSQSGLIPISLVAVSDKGCRDSLTYLVKVFPLPDVKFTAEKVCFNSPVQFNNTSTISTGIISSIAWDLGGELQTTDENPVHIFSEEKTYQIQLNVVSSEGCEASIIQNYQVLQLPKPNFSISAACQNELAQLVETSTTAPTITEWYWLINDTLELTGKEHFVNIPSIGLNNIQLNVISNEGCSSLVTGNIFIFEAPQANFSFSPGCGDDPNYFYDETISLLGGLTSWHWNFGDGTASSDKEPIHLYNTLGSYEASLLVTNEFGCKDSISKMVFKLELPVADAVIENAQGCPPLEVKLYPDVQYNTNNFYNWNLSNGMTLSGDTAIFVLEESSFIDLQVIANTVQGCYDTLYLNESIFVYPVPKSAISVLPRVVDMWNPDVVAVNMSEGETSFIIDFGLDAYLDEEKIYYKYQDSGYYKVFIYTVNEFGCRDTAYDLVRVNPVFAYYIPNTITIDDNTYNPIFNGKGIGIETYEMYIFNRWGELIFETTDEWLGWDGTHHGKKVPDGVYIYKINIRDILGVKHEYVGHVNVLK
jgi:gliding motility-associated-like protein